MTVGGRRCGTLGRGHQGQDDSVVIPLQGMVAAGQPYAAYAVDEALAVPGALWRNKRVFAVRVRGNSMIDEGIHDGDFLIVEPREAAENGQTVVAEVDGGVTVKVFGRGGDGRIRLRPANPAMLPLVVTGDRVRIIGIVVGVLRKFGCPRDSGTRHGGMAAVRSRATSPAPVHRPRDLASIDLVVNAIDGQLARWKAAMERVADDRAMRPHVARMAELGRDLQAIRDWCGRTNKERLRRALVAEANRLMRKMQRLAASAPLVLPDLFSAGAECPGP